MSGRPRRESDPAHIAAAVVRSAPKIDRPRLAEEFERRLYESDRQRASSYAAIESVTDQLREIADDLISDDGLAVPVEVSEEEDDSLVLSIAAATRSS